MRSEQKPGEAKYGWKVHHKSQYYGRWNVRCNALCYGAGAETASVVARSSYYVCTRKEWERGRETFHKRSKLFVRNRTQSTLSTNGFIFHYNFLISTRQKRNRCVCPRCRKKRERNERNTNRLWVTNRLLQKDEVLASKLLLLLYFVCVCDEPVHRNWFVRT